MKHMILIVFTIGVCSCDRYLDIVPKGKVIPQRTKDYRMLMDQTNSSGQSSGFVNAYSNDLFMSDDVAVNPFVASMYSASEQNAIRFMDHLFLDSEADPDWETMYNTIYVCNLVIDQVMQSQDGSEHEKRELMAEARVQRAFAYLILVNLYAKAYNAATAQQDIGVPLRMKSDFEEKLPRASVQQIYDFILQELTISSGQLSSAPESHYNHRPSEAALQALLARTYLLMGKYEQAVIHADNSLKLYDTLIDYNSLPMSNIFIGNRQMPLDIENSEILMSKTSLSPSSLFYASQDLIDLFDRDHDLRIRTNFADDAAFGLNFGFLSTMWSGRTPQKGPTTAESLLIRAECYARAGKVQEAMADLQKLRAARYVTGSNYNLEANTPEQALEFVKQERRRELAFMGIRLFDIKRYNLHDNAQIGIQYNIDGQDYSLEHNSIKWALPIARKYISLNPEILQNPR